MSAQSLRPSVDEECDTVSSRWDSPEEILNQLERVVNSAHFRNSKRYPALLRYLVQESLLGRVDCLKERTLGIEVFGRSPDYDTNSDPVVRITAGEVRKRIAQYYQAPDHENELRLELPLGSYVPHFLPPHESKQPSAAPYLESANVAAVVVQGMPVAPVSRQQTPLNSQATIEINEHFEAANATPNRDVSAVEAPRPLSRTRRKFVQAIGLLGICAICAIVAVILWNAHERDAGLDSFWGPFLQSKDPAMIALGTHSFDIRGNDVSPVSFAQLPQGEHTALSSMIRWNMVPVSDVVSYSELVSLLTQKGIPFRTQSAAETSMEEFRRGPIILIGGFDNMWTMRLTSSLRFRFIADSESLHEIQDSQHPAIRWLYDNAQSALSNSRDYAIVARFFDPGLEQNVLIVAGIGMNGTEAAARFVTDKRALQTWAQTTSSKKLDNVEIVLATDVIEGKHGPAHVIETYRW